MSCNSVDLIVPGVLSNRGRFSVTFVRDAILHGSLGQYDNSRSAIRHCYCLLGCHRLPAGCFEKP